MPTDLLGVPNTPLVASSGGAKLTISAILKDPTFIEAYLLSIDNYLFVADKLFRTVQDCPSGTVIYYASTPVFADNNAPVVAEFIEIPTAMTGLGVPSTAISQRLALAVLVSEQMRTRNNVDALNIQLRQVRNTLVRGWDQIFMANLQASIITSATFAAGGWQASHQVAAGSTWGNASDFTARTDIASSEAVIANEERGFMPDFLLIDQTTYFNMLGNPAAWQIYLGNIANLNPQFIGKLPMAIMGLDTYVTINGNIPVGSAYVGQRGIFGGISNERPLRATPWYEHRPEETWRSDVSRVATSFVDQPAILVQITGVR
jgi:hypothetical protein